ncbi:MAG: chemotaxis protein CheW [Gemmatimonas sp.]
MANLQPPVPTDRNAHVLVEEEDERERVLLVVARGRDGLEMMSYAMNVSLVREVIGARAVTRVPGTPAVMRGLVNVRGMVVTVLDLARCLGQADPPSHDITPAKGPSSGHETATRAQMPGSIVLLEQSGRLVGLAVDSVRDVRPLDDVGLVREGSAFRDEDVFVRGLASAGGELVTLLDVAALLARHLISSGET